MGFCFYNNVALAALSLLKRGVERVLIFDWACDSALAACQLATAALIAHMQTIDCLSTGP